MARNKKFDTLECQGAIQNQLKLMDEAMEILKKEVTKGTELQDKLLLSQPSTIDIELVRLTGSNLHTAARNARHIYGETREFLDGVYFRIQEELSTACNMDSVQYHSLKKLRTVVTDAKQKLRGYNINKMEELAFKTVDRINKAAEKHYPVRNIK